MLIPSHLHFQPLAERIYNRYPNPMQAARNLIALMLEFSSRMQHRHNHFQRGFLCLCMRVYRNTPAIVYDCQAAVQIYFYIYILTKTSDSFVYTITNDLFHEVV